MLAACSAPGGLATPNLLDNLLGNPTPAAATATSAADAEDDKGACTTAAQCKSVLKTMIDDPQRSGWVGKQQPPEAYASGTRLFAYRALRKRLTCGELTLVVDEMRAASKAMSGAVPSMTPDQLSRTRELCTQVENELVKERGGRCQPWRAQTGGRKA
jgi:hypothetical protein